MQKIISEEKRKRIERNTALVADYKEGIANGSDKTALYRYLAEKYDLKSAASVYSIIKKEINQTKRKRNKKVVK
jgi:hypothetical protein